jgi:hypothetical protein
LDIKSSGADIGATGVSIALSQAAAILVAHDVLEVDGQDVRSDPSRGAE